MHPPSGHNGIKPVFVFGISGATWKVITPLAEKGRLPNMQRLIEEGCHGTIRSIRVEGDKHYRPQTAWPTLATGVVPQTHGITRYWYTSEDLKAETIWDIFERNGQNTGLYGWPITWPPRKTGGFMIPCHHARDSRTQPPEFHQIKELDQRQKAIEREKGFTGRIFDGVKSAAIITKYGMRAATLRYLAGLFGKYLSAMDSEERTLLMRFAKLELSIDFFLRLNKSRSPAFVNFTSFLADLVSHRYWRYYEPTKFGEKDLDAVRHFGGAVEDAYEKLDTALGRCLAEMTSDTIVAVVSEHGMAAEVESAEVGPYRYMIQGSHLLKLVGLDENFISCPVARWIAVRHRKGTALEPSVAERIKRVIIAETGLSLFNVHTYGNNEVIVKFNIDRKVELYNQCDLEN